MKIRSERWALPLGLIFAIALAVTTGWAHQGTVDEGSPSAPPATHMEEGAGTTAPPGNEDMSGMKMPETEMSWPTGDQTGMTMGHKPKPKTLTGRTVAWLGAWHPAVIHFPIALTLTVAFLELASGVRRKPIYAAGNKILLAIAVLGAFVAAPLGWANAGLPTDDDSWALSAHRWLGTVLPFLLLLLWYLKRSPDGVVAKPKLPTEARIGGTFLDAEQTLAETGARTYQALLGLAVLLILAQAYLGGEITHGANHMAF